VAVAVLGAGAAGRLAWQSSRAPAALGEVRAGTGEIPLVLETDDGTYFAFTAGAVVSIQGRRVTLREGARVVVGHGGRYTAWFRQAAVRRTMIAALRAGSQGLWVRDGSFTARCGIAKDSFTIRVVRVLQGA
jgi:hypothetical protein